MDWKRIEELGHAALAGWRMTAWFILVCAVGGVVLGVGGAYSALTYADPTCPDCAQDPTGSFIVAFVAMVALVAGVVALVWASNGKNDAVYRLLAKRAHEVVWVTSLPTRRKGRQLEHVSFHLASGQRGVASMLVPAQHAGEIMATLHRLLPHASFGLEFAESYMANPSSLRRA